LIRVHDPAGHTQEEISTAWREARRAGHTEATGLGMDWLTVAGKARVSEVGPYYRITQPSPSAKASCSSTTRLGDGLLDLLGNYPDAPARLAMPYGLNGWLVQE
jgi:hypothetical protein